MRKYPGDCDQVEIAEVAPGVNETSQTGHNPGNFYWLL